MSTQVPVRIFDSSLNLATEIAAYESLYFTRAWSGIGAWSLNMNWNIKTASELQRGKIIMLGSDGRKSGIITQVTKSQGKSGKGSQTITAEGVELKGITARRIVLPPSGSAAYNANSNAENVLKTLISACMGPAAVDVNRRISALSIATNQNRGPNYVLSVAGTRLNEELTTLANATALGWWMTFDPVNKLFVLECGMGTDRTAGQYANGRAIFSAKMGTMASGQVTDSDLDYRNFAYVGGSGSGSVRIIRPYPSSAIPTGLDRREIWVDSRGLTTNADLDAQGAQILVDKAAAVTAECSILASSPLRYQVDFDIGDLVTIDTFDLQLSKRIQSVRESWGRGTYDIDATFDKPYPTLNSQQIEAQRAALKAINAL